MFFILVPCWPIYILLYAGPQPLRICSLSSFSLRSMAENEHTFVPFSAIQTRASLMYISIGLCVSFQIDTRNGSSERDRSKHLFLAALKLNKYIRYLQMFSTLAAQYCKGIKATHAWQEHHRKSFIIWKSDLPTVSVARRMMFPTFISCYNYTLFEMPQFFHYLIFALVRFQNYRFNTFRQFISILHGQHFFGEQSSCTKQIWTTVESNMSHWKYQNLMNICQAEQCPMRQEEITFNHDLKTTQKIELLARMHSGKSI